MKMSVVLLIMWCAGIACNTSKYHGSKPNTMKIDSLPATIIEPARKNKPPLSADTTSLNPDYYYEIFEELNVFNVSETIDN